MWGHGQGIIRMEQDHALDEDHNSFKMCRMTVRTDQLLHIAEAINSNVYIQESEAEAHGQTTALVLSLKQYNAYHYWLYEKGTTRAMVGLQGLHLSNAFRCSNVSSSVGLKSFCPWCFKLGRKAKMITTHLREVHYRLVIACNICKSFASMCAQSILDHCSGCKAKCTKEHAEQDRQKRQKSHTRKSPSYNNKKTHPNH